MFNRIKIIGRMGRYNDNTADGDDGAAFSLFRKGTFILCSITIINETLRYFSTCYGYSTYICFKNE